MSIKKNFIYNILYQLLSILLPLVTIPYVSRVIGSDGIGKYSFTYSIVYYFMIFAMLGLNNYGNRMIAKNRDDITNRSKIYNEIRGMQILTTAISFLCYIILIFFIPAEYRLLSFIQLFHLMSCFFDINWFFYGMENFKIALYRNSIIKLISLLLIFVFVKQKNDVWVYTLILSVSTLLSQLIPHFYIKKYIINVKIDFKNIRKHIIPCFKLVLPVIAVAIYKFMDKTMIGIFSNMKEVGFYENAEKILNVPTTIISALGLVMLPRMTNLYSKEENKKAYQMIEKTMEFSMFLCFPMVLGLISVSKEFISIYLGLEFNKTYVLLNLLSITCLFISWGNVIRTQFLIPKEKDRDFIISAFLGAIVNFLLNIVLIRIYQSIGACFATIIAEFVVAFYQTYKVRKFLPIKKYLRNSYNFLLKAIIMSGILIVIDFVKVELLYKIIIKIMVGIIIYLSLNIRYILKIINYKNIKN